MDETLPELQERTGQLCPCTPGMVTALSFWGTQTGTSSTPGMVTALSFWGAQTGTPSTSGMVTAWSFWGTQTEPSRTSGMVTALWAQTGTPSRSPRFVPTGAAARAGGFKERKMNLPWGSGALRCPQGGCAHTEPPPCPPCVSPLCTGSLGCSQPVGTLRTWVQSPGELPAACSAQVRGSPGHGDAPGGHLAVPALAQAPGRQSS